jgi:hypothetical protein
MVLAVVRGLIFSVVHWEWCDDSNAIQFPRPTLNVWYVRIEVQWL